MKTHSWYFRMQQEEIEQFIEVEYFERLIYEAIKSYSGNAKLDIALSVRQIAARATISYSTVSRFLPKLIAKGMVKTVGTKNRVGGPINIYKVLLPATVSVATGNTLIEKSVAVSKESVAVSQKSVAGVASTPPQPNNLKPNIPIGITTETKKPLQTQEPFKTKEPKTLSPYKPLVVLFNRKYGTNLFPTFGKQAMALKKILQSYSEPDIWACAEWVSKQPWAKEKGFDFATILNQIPKYKMVSQRKENTYGYRNAKDVDTTNF